jgi:hypothetical protein
MIIKKVRKTNKNETVYVVRWVHDNKIYSPFQKHRWKIRTEYTLNDNKRLRKWRKRLEHGVFHCLTNDWDAKGYINELKTNNRIGEFRIYRAVIPKGTWIAEGEIPNGFIGYGRKCIGARRMWIDRKVETIILKSKGVQFYHPSGTSASTSGYLTSTTVNYGTSSTTGGYWW